MQDLIGDQLQTIAAQRREREETVEGLKIELQKARAEVERSMRLDYWGIRAKSAEEYAQKVKVENEALRLENETLRRRVDSLEGLTPLRPLKEG